MYKEVRSNSDRSTISKKTKSLCAIGLVLLNSIFLDLILESLNRRSIWGGIDFLLNNPLLFIYNSLIILIVLSLSLFSKKNIFWEFILGIIWLGIGITDFVLLGLRTNPLSWIDFQIFLTALNVVPSYLNTFQIILVILSFLFAIAIAIIVYRLTPKQKPSYLFCAIIFIVMILFFCCFTFICHKTDVLPSNIEDLNQSYEDYGFVYCFSISIFDRGITKQEDYSEQEVKRIINSLPEISSSEQKPNIIIIQLESFFDINRLKDVTYSNNPIPVWTSLREDYGGGLLTVPTIGAGTANTEFEVLTGMNLDDFGAGEYPFESILKTNVCESISYILKDIDYSTHAIHNHTAEFYDRNLVYSNLGFDSFTPIECMTDIKRNSIGWAKDEMIADEILNVLDSTNGLDFIYAITVECHGKYPDDFSSDDGLFSTFHNSELSLRVNRNAFNYYLNSLYETDKAIGILLDGLSKRKEPTIVVLFGDHFPALNFCQEDLIEGNLYETEYVIWNNFQKIYETKNIYSFQLYSEVLDLAGIHNGYINRINQSRNENPSYYHDLSILEYDILYGNQFCYEGQIPYEATPIVFGLETPSIESVVKKDGGILIKGKQFNEFSRVEIKNRSYEPEMITENSLFVKNVNLRPLDIICITQKTEKGTILSESMPFCWLPSFKQNQY